MLQVGALPIALARFGPHRNDQDAANGLTAMLLLATLGLLSTAAAIGQPIPFAEIFSLT